MRECHANKAVEAGVQPSYVHSSVIDEVMSPRSPLSRYLVSCDRIIQNESRDLSTPEMELLSWSC